MPLPQKRPRVLPFAAVSLLALIVIFIISMGPDSLYRMPAWTVDAIRLKLSLKQDASADAYYNRTKSGLLPLATVVREMREAWPKENITLIHQAALEVGTGLLHRSDIAAGELVDGTFVPFSSPSWNTNADMIYEVMNSSVLFENDHRYVFRRK